MSWNLQAGGRQRAHQSGEIAPTSGARDGSDGGNRADKQQGGGDRANASGGRREALAAPADGARPHMKEDKLTRTHHAPCRFLYTVRDRRILFHRYPMK